MPIFYENQSMEMLTYRTDLRQMAILIIINISFPNMNWDTQRILILLMNTPKTTALLGMEECSDDGEDVQT